MFISSSSASHGSARGGFIHFLLVRPLMLVSRNVSRSVNYVHPSRLTLPTSAVVETLLVRACKLGGVRKTAHRRGGHGSRDSCDDGRLPFNQLEDLGLGLLSSLVFVFLSGQLSKCSLELVVRDGAAGFLLDFAEDDVHVSEGDALAVNHVAVLAEFGPVLAVHLLARSSCVTVDGEASKRLLQSSQLHRCGRAHASIAGPIGLR